MADFEKVIPPGREGRVDIKIDGKKLTGSGHFKKTFTVKTNDPENAQFVLVVEGQIQKTFDFSEDLKLAGFADEKLKTEIIITNMLPTPVNITSVRWAGDVAQRHLIENVGLKIETIAKGKKYRLKLWKKNEMAPGSFNANVVLVTDHPKIKEKTVPVAFIISSDVELMPNRMIWGEMVVKSGAPKTFDRIFTIRALRGDSLKVLRAQPNRDDMKVSIKEITPGKVFQGTVSITPDTKAAQYLGAIKIQTNYRRCQLLNLDIVGSVRQEGK
ncbi:MAG: hypothetical protein PHD74_06590 [Candidatus Krumholzibacteria bacterium]|nr:hypothetical protein [Candidatus Krumholzibacteria bacterium]